MYSLQKSIISGILDNAQKNPGKVIIQVDNKSILYKDFVSVIQNIAPWIESSGIRPGDTCALILPNSIEWYYLFWAIVAVGARPVPLDPQIGEWEFKQLFLLMEFKACFITEKYRANPLLKNIQRVFKESKNEAVIILTNTEMIDPPGMRWTDFLSSKNMSDGPIKVKKEPGGLLMYACTSGTTGNPKIIAVEHEGFFQAQKDMAEYLELSEKDIMLLGMPLYHQGGFGMGVQAVLSCSTIVYQSRFNPVVFLEIIEKWKVTVVQLTATLAKILMTVPEFETYDLSSLRLVYFAGEVLPDHIAEKFYKDLGIRVVNIIGSTETATMVVWDSLYDQGSGVNDFRPLDFTKVKIIGEDNNEIENEGTGRILVHTDAILREYFGNPEETRKRIWYRENERWFDTGDLGRRLPDGRIRFVGRVKRVIKRGSNLVFPEEIESFLLYHPFINAVAVCKDVNEIIGELIIAYIQLVENKQVTQGDLIKYCKGKISSYKIPDSFIFVDEIPNDIGKVQFKYLSKTEKE